MKRVFKYIVLLVFYGISNFAFDEKRTSLSPDQIILKAVDARGGKGALTKFLNYRERVKGTMYNGDMSAPVTVVSLNRTHPMSYKNLVEIKPSDVGLIRETVVFNGTKVWQQRNGLTREGSDEDLRTARVSAYYAYVQLLFPLLDNNDFKLSELPSIRINNTDAVGVRVASQGYSDIQLYFDKKTFLLVKSSCQSKGKGTDDDTLREEYFEEYKIQNGVKCATHTTFFKNGKKIVETTLVDIEPLRNIEDSEFSKP